MSTVVRPGTRIVVADTAANHATPFWSTLVGKEGLVMSVCDDGLWDVTIVGSHPFIPGVVPTRFIVVDEVLTAPESVWARLAPTFYVLLVFAIITVVCYFLPTCTKAASG